MKNNHFMKSIYFVNALLLISFLSFSQKKESGFKHTVIYELSPKGFTSPNGPESGTFRSTEEKIPYLKKLGVNTIWLTGHNWADNGHFYGIWTQYAVFRPDSIEPTLGSRNDFKSLIKTAHRHNIKVFLDVITHGVMPNSSLVKTHPDWFKAGSWGMIDYDWKGKHPDLDDWWVKTWTDYALKCDVDGFRLDVNIYRPDLWIRIKQICAQKGKPVFVLDEGDDPYTPGAFDAYQHRARFMDHKEPNLNPTCLYLTDVAKYFMMDKSQQDFYYSIQLSCHDNGWQPFPADVNPYVGEGSRYLFGYSCLFTPAMPVFMSGEEFNADYKPLPRLTPDLYSKKPPGDNSKWLYGSWLQWNQLEKIDKKAMWDDVQHMLSIRTKESDIIHAFKSSDVNKKILPVKGDYDKNLPVPYLMWNKNKAILVAANPDEKKDNTLVLDVPLEETGIKSDRFKVTDLWNETKPFILSKDELKAFKISIKKDKQPKGGVAVYKIEAI